MKGYLDGCARRIDDLTSRCRFCSIGPCVMSQATAATMTIPKTIRLVSNTLRKKYLHCEQNINKNNKTIRQPGPIRHLISQSIHWYVEHGFSLYVIHPYTSLSLKIMGIAVF